MKIKFTPCVGLKDMPSHDTLEAAFRAFHAEVTKTVKERVSIQWLQSCWIDVSNQRLPYFFNELVELAHKEGWLKNGKLQKPLE